MLTDQEIEGLALAHEDYGFGQVGSDGVSAHGFDAPGVLAFARAIEQAATAPLLARIAELERSLARARKVRRRAVATLYKRALDAEAKLAEKDALARSGITPSSA